MGLLQYGMITSLDGFVADADGDFQWGEPSDDEHGFVNEQQAGIGTSIYGRRLYEIMAFWETHEADRPVEEEFGRLWRAHDKIVVSSSLEAPTTERTTLLRSLDAPALAALKAELPGTISIGGPTIAADAIRSGLVDEYQFYVCPVVLGGGLRALPVDVRLDLVLVEQRAFDNGVVFLRYRPR